MATWPVVDSARFTAIGRKMLLPLLIAIVCYAALAFYADAEQLGNEVSHYRYEYMVGALGLSFGNFLLRALRWDYYLRRVKIRVPLWESVLVSLAGLVMTVTPGKVGELFKALLLKWTHDTPLSEASGTVVAERVSDLIGLLLLTAWGALALDSPAPALVSLALACSVTLIGSVRPAGYWLIGILGKAPLFRSKVHRLCAAYDSLMDTLRGVPLLVGVSVAVVAWGLQVAAVSLLVLGLPEDASLSLQHASLALSGPMIAGVVSLVPGGLGVTEAGMAHLLQLLDNPWATPAAAVAVTLLARVATLWWAVLVGAVAMAMHQKLTGWKRRTLVRDAEGA